jgi:hypothetical protein
MIKFVRCSLLPLFALAVACGSDADPGTNTTTGAGATGAGASGGTGAQTTGAGGMGGTAPVGTGATSGTGAGGAPSSGGTTAAGSGGSAGGISTGGSAGTSASGGTSSTGGSAGASATGGSGGDPGGPWGNTTCTTWPTSTGSQKYQNEEVTNFDGGMKRFTGNSSGGDEGQDPIFIVKNGGTLKNVIIGDPPADGIHCEGSCTLQNVWWEAVGDDAATLEGSSDSQVMTIDCGGVKGATDKVFQHNGPGKMVIKNFTVINSDKFYRSCGNCDEQHERHVELSNITTNMLHTLVGLNQNYGDTAKIQNIVASYGVKICERYQGNDNGDEPTSLGTGPDGTHCLYQPSDIHLP